MGCCSAAKASAFEIVTWVCVHLHAQGSARRHQQSTNKKLKLLLQRRPERNSFFV
jgi:hypothetical protein